MEQTIESIARVCHEANRAWCIANGDDSQKHWEDAEQWQKDSAIEGVIFKMNHPGAGDSAQHDAWSKSKIADGWVYGEVKDAEKKTHPCLVDFDQLPEFQQKKDKLFGNIVEALSRFVVDFSQPLTHDDNVILDKRSRIGLDKELQALKKLPLTRERSLSITKLQESIMWLGMDLKRLNETNPYPDSYNDGNTKIAPTADGLKL